MQYNQRVLRPRSTPKPTLNQITILYLVVLVFVFFFLSLFLLRLSERRYCIYRQRSHDDKSARVISKALRSRALEIERFFYGKREHSRESALRHHGLEKKEKDAFEQKRIFKSHAQKRL